MAIKETSQVVPFWIYYNTHTGCRPKPTHMVVERSPVLKPTAFKDWFIKTSLGDRCSKCRINMTIKRITFCNDQQIGEPSGKEGDKCVPCAYMSDKSKTNLRKE